MFVRNFVVLLVAAAVACGGAGADDQLAEELSSAALPLDPFPAKCGLGSIDSFEKSAQPWHAASWASATTDANGAPAVLSTGAFGATDGTHALSVPVRFTGAGYEQGYVGREGLSVSLAGCASIAFDVTLPPGAPQGLRGSVILLLGPAGAWNGQADPVALVPGATVTVRLPLAGGIEPVPARALLKQLAGLGLKLDASAVSWSGNVAIDHVRVEGLQPPSAEDLGATPVGTFGGFQDSTGANLMLPTRNGFLTFTADAAVQGHALLWPKLGAGGGDLVVGTAWFGGTTPSPSPAQLAFRDWVTLESRQDLAGGGSARVLMSRAFPAVRYTSDAQSFTWTSGAAQMALVENGAVVTHPLQGRIDLSSMSEPWILLWGDATAPLLLTFQHRPASAVAVWGGVEFDFGSAEGSVQAMPLYGLRRGAFSFDDAVVQARALTPLLAAFPVGLHETSAVNEAAQTVAIVDSYDYETIADDWSTTATPVAALPPTIVLAGRNGYGVSYPQAPVETSVATWFGPFAYVAGAQARYVLPLPAALSREPVALRVNNSAASRPVRAELERVLTDEVPSEPGTYWLGNDESDANFLCESWHTLLPGSAARLKAQTAGPRLAENTFLSRSTALFTEPVSGQRYLAPTSYPEQNLPFDKEWNSGRQLASVARCSESIDLDVARGLWPKLLATYRYHRIFFDWATGSVLSSTLGLTELADGMHFAWDGMLGVGRLSKKLGDTHTFADAAYRTARQEAALYAAWVQAQWTKDIDYGIGHISDVKLPQSEIETRGAIDGWVEDFGCSTLEFKSFWQTTNYLYFDVPAQLSLYRDTGLEPRVRALEYQLMPSFHPAWADGNAMDPVDQRYYGSNYTAAHLVARAALFHDDPATLFAMYQSARGTQASQQWYSMFFHGLAGPTLLAIERGRAPLVEAPVGSIRLAAASWDAATGKVSVDFQALRSGTASFRARKPGGTFRAHPFAVIAGKRYTAAFVP